MEGERCPMLWSHSPRPQGFACPGLGLLGPSVPPHDPSPGPHTPGGNSRGSPWPPVPKRRPQWGNHISGRWHRKRSHLQRVPLLCLTVHGVKVKFWIFGRCLSRHAQPPSASFRGRGHFGTDLIPLNPTPFLVTMGTLHLPDSWHHFHPA